MADDSKLDDDSNYSDQKIIDPRERMRKTLWEIGILWAIVAVIVVVLLLLQPRQPLYCINSNSSTKTCFVCPQNTTVGAIANACTAAHTQLVNVSLSNSS